MKSYSSRLISNGGSAVRPFLARQPRFKKGSKSEIASVRASCDITSSLACRLASCGLEWIEPWCREGELNPQGRILSLRPSLRNSHQLNSFYSLRLDLPKNQSGRFAPRSDHDTVHAESSPCWTEAGNWCWLHERGITSPETPEIQLLACPIEVQQISLIAGCIG